MRCEEKRWLRVSCNCHNESVDEYKVKARYTVENLLSSSSFFEHSKAPSFLQSNSRRSNSLSKQCLITSHLSQAHLTLALHIHLNQTSPVSQQINTPEMKFSVAAVLLLTSSVLTAPAVTTTKSTSKITTKTSTKTMTTTKITTTGKPTTTAITTTPQPTPTGPVVPCGTNVYTNTEFDTTTNPWNLEVNVDGAATVTGGLQSQYPAPWGAVTPSTYILNYTIPAGGWAGGTLTQDINYNLTMNFDVSFMGAVGGTNPDILCHVEWFAGQGNLFPIWGYLPKPKAVFSWYTFKGTAYGVSQGWERKRIGGYFSCDNNGASAGTVQIYLDAGSAVGQCPVKNIT